MKKIYFLAASLLLSAGAMAQLNNGGLEAWSSSDPTGWDTFDGLFPTITGLGGTVTVAGANVTETVVQETTSPIEGTSYASIQSVSISGMSSYGVPDGVYGNYIQQEVVTSTKFGGVKFSYQASINGTDVVGVFVNATKWNGTSEDVVAQGFKTYSTNTSGWVTDSIVLSSYSGAPDTITIIFASSFGTVINGTGAPTPTQDGTIMKVDGISLLPALMPADPATNVVASDVANNGNGLDLNVTFDAAADETTVSEYRIFVMKQGLMAANWGMIPGGYGSVAPTGAPNYSFTFNASSIYFSDSAMYLVPRPIVEDTIYDVYVLSVPDGTNANASTISAKDSTVLKHPNTAGIINLSMDENEIRVYPNPANNFVSVAFQNSDMASTIELYNVTGQLMTSVPASIVTKLDLSSFNSGLYFVKIFDKNNQVIRTEKVQVVK
jgi:hypothetical protein